MAGLAACRDRGRAMSTLVVLETHPRATYPPRVIGIAADGETPEQILVEAREHFAALGMAPGILTAELASDELIAEYEAVGERAGRPRPLYGPFVVDAAGVLLRKVPGRIHIVPMSRREIARGEVSW